MGLRGPAPKPTILKRQEGNPGRRPLNDRRPKPGNGPPRMPQHLDDAARLEWRRLVRILTKMRVLTEADGIALSTLCQAYSTMGIAQAQLSKTGIIFKTPNGFLQQNPLLKLVNQQAEIIIRYLREFGLTPASRSRLTARSLFPTTPTCSGCCLRPRPEPKVN